MRKLDKEARVWDVYSGLDLYVKNLLTSLRAVSHLQNLAIRERHWAQLVRTTQVHAVEVHVHDSYMTELFILTVIIKFSNRWTSLLLTAPPWTTSWP